MASLLSFALMLWGFGLARSRAPELWQPPRWTAHLTALLMLPAFLLWAVVDFAAARGRDRRAGTRNAAGAVARDVSVISVGLAAWALFAASLHGVLIGVRPFG